MGGREVMMLKPMRWKQRGQTQGAGLLNRKRNRHLVGSSVLSSLQGQNIGHCPAPWMVRRARDHRSDFIYLTEIPSAFQCLGSWLPPFQKHAPSLCLSTKPWAIVLLNPLPYSLSKESTFPLWHAHHVGPPFTVVPLRLLPLLTIRALPESSKASHKLSCGL